MDELVVPDLKACRLQMDYVEESFETLFLRQQSSRKKDRLSQLGQDGFGFICLRHDVDIPRGLKSDMELLLRKSDIQVFRNEELGDKDPCRLQLLTTFGSTYNDLEKVNASTKVHTQVFLQCQLHFFQTYNIFENTKPFNCTFFSCLH